MFTAQSLFYSAPRVSETERNAYEARRRFNDIVARVFSGDTERDDLLNCLRCTADVLVREMANVRQCESNLHLELHEALRAADFVEREHALVCEGIKRDAAEEGHRYGLAGDNADIFESLNVNGGVSVSLGAYSSSKPPSGRASPLLRTSSEAIHVPRRPNSVGARGELRMYDHERASQTGDDQRSPLFAGGVLEKHGLFPEDSAGGMNKIVECKQSHGERVAYRYITQRHAGSLAHRAHAMRALQAAFDVDLCKKLPRRDMQLAFFYCVYTSSAVRDFVCMRSHPNRPREFACLHASRVRTFMCGLNKLTEEYDLRRINADTYLASLRHLHTFNFVPALRDEDVAQCMHRVASTSSMEYYGRRAPWPDVRESSNEVLKRSLELRRSSPALVIHSDDAELRRLAKSDERNHGRKDSSDGCNEDDDDDDFFDFENADLGLDSRDCSVATSDMQEE